MSGKKKTETSVIYCNISKSEHYSPPGLPFCCFQNQYWYFATLLLEIVTEWQYIKFYQSIVNTFMFFCQPVFNCLVKSPFSLFLPLKVCSTAPFLLFLPLEVCSTAPFNFCRLWRFVQRFLLYFLNLWRFVQRLLLTFATFGGLFKTSFCQF